MKGGAGPAHRWCGKEDAFPKLPLAISDGQGNLAADPLCVAEHCAQELKRDTIGFNKETSSFRARREQHFEEAREWAGNLGLRSESLSLFPVQDGDRPRPARIQRHRPPP